jgi:hypothetical protein
MSNPVQPAFGTLAPLDVPAAEIISQSANFNAALLSTNFVNTTSGAVVATLPDATQSPGKGLVVFCTVHGSGNNVTFASVNSQTVNSAAASSLTALSAANTGYVFLSDGNNWFAASGLAIK